ncbi:MAG TPA: alpha/beta hydrolase [Anaerolineales bacterium]
MGAFLPAPTILERVIRRYCRKLAVLYLPGPKGDVRRAYGPERSQFGDLYLPPGAGLHPVLIAIHGGFWRAKYGLEHLGHLCKALTGLGLATWNVEYRRLGQPGGGWPGTFQDIGMAAQRVEALAGEFPLDLGRLAVLGHSAGGHLALWLAAASAGRAISGVPELGDLRLPPLRSAISMAGVSDLAAAWEMGLGAGVVSGLMNGSPKQYPERYAAASPVEMLPIGIPQILLHGRLDATVPFALSERYAAVAESYGDPVRLVPLEGLGHFELIDPRSAAWPVVTAAVLIALQ